MFGDVQVYWNITPPVVTEFEAVSGTVTMRDGQSIATITLRVCNTKQIEFIENSRYCLYLFTR